MASNGSYRLLLLILKGGVQREWEMRPRSYLSTHVKKLCKYDDGRVVHARGMCHRHYDQWRRYVGDNFIPDQPARNPLVCVCPEPLADPRVKFGQCERCGRKPLALFGQYG